VSFIPEPSFPAETLNKRKATSTPLGGTGRETLLLESAHGFSRRVPQCQVGGQASPFRYTRVVVRDPEPTLRTVVSAVAVGLKWETSKGAYDTLPLLGRFAKKYLAPGFSDSVWYGSEDLLVFYREPHPNSIIPSSRCLQKHSQGRTRPVQSELHPPPSGFTLEV